MTCRLIGPTCVVHSCLRPAREWGDYCTSHFQGLSAEQRAGLRWEHEHTQPTEPLDSLEVLWLLPSAEDGPRAA